MTSGGRGEDVVDGRDASPLEQGNLEAGRDTFQREATQVSRQRLAVERFPRSEARRCSV